MDTPFRIEINTFEAFVQFVAFIRGDSTLMAAMTARLNTSSEDLGAAERADGTLPHDVTTNKE